MGEQRIVVYKIENIDSLLNQKDEFTAKIGNINGVTAVDINIDEKDLILRLDAWASEYDVLTSAIKIGEEYGTNISFDDEEVEETKIEPSQKEDVDIETEKNEEKKREEKVDFIEKILTIGLSFLCIVVGLFFGGIPSVQGWIYTFAFAFAGYEVLLSAISKLTEKKKIIEEILVVVSSLILLYLGKRLSGSIVVFSYSLLNFVYNLLENKIKSKMDKMAKREENKNDFEKFYDRYNLIGQVFQTVNDKKITTFYIVLSVVAVLLSFIPPFFNISEYGNLLLSKWLYVGAGVVSFSQVGVFLKAISDVKKFSLLKLVERGTSLYSVDDLDKISQVNKVVFDKTGIVTFPKAEIEEIISDDKDHCVELLKIAESGIVHPIAESIADNDNAGALENRIYKKDKGISCIVDGKKVLIGNKKFMIENGVEIKEYTGNFSPVYLAENGRQIGVVAFKYSLKNNFVGAVLELKNDLGVKSEIISSDCLNYVENLKEETGVSKAIASATDAYKIKYVTESGGLYVGHGEYDGEILSELNFSISMERENGRSLASVSGDVNEIPVIIKTARREKKIYKQNLIISLISKILLFVAFLITSFLTEADCLWWYIVTEGVIACLLEMNALRNLSDPV